MTIPKATVGPSPEDTQGFAKLVVNTLIADSKSVGEETINGNRVTLRRHVLKVTRILPNKADGLKVVAITLAGAGQEVQLSTDIHGRLRDYNKILVQTAS